MQISMRHVFHISFKVNAVVEYCSNDGRMVFDRWAQGRIEWYITAFRRQNTRLTNYLKSSAPQERKFYCEIKFFIYEITSRLLRDKFFYLVVEFCILPREFFLLWWELFLVAWEIIFVRMRIIFHPHGNSVLSRRPVSPFATYDKSVRIGLKAILPLRIESGTKPGRHTMTNRLSIQPDYRKLRIRPFWQAAQQDGWHQQRLCLGLHHTLSLKPLPSR